MAKILPERYPRRSLSAGPKRRIHRNQIDELPFAKEALAWLLGFDEGHSLRRLIQLARVRRVITGRGNGWHAERRVIDRLIGLRKKPTAKAIFGLGELLAFSHMEASPLLKPLGKLSDRLVFALLGQLEGYAKRYGEPTVLEETMIGERLGESDFSTATFHYARSYIEHRPHAYRKIFGFQVATETLLMLHPHAFGRWLSRKRWPPVTHTILSYVADRLIFTSEGDVFPKRVMQTGLPALQAMAAIARTEPFFGRTPKSFEETYVYCEQAGLGDYRAFVLALPGIQADIINRKRLQLKVTASQNAFCADVLKDLSQPTQRTQALRMQTLATLETEKAESAAEESKVDHLLSLVAGRWPASGMTAAGADLVFDMLRPEPVELCSRLVGAAGGRPGVDALRDRIIKEVFCLIGIQDPQAALKAQSHYVPEELPELCRWAAANFSIVQRKAGKSLGQQTSIKVGALVDQAKSIIHAPYAMARGLHYYPAISAYAAALMFAFAMVAEGTKAGQDMERLLSNILDAVETLVRTDRAPNPNFIQVDEIARLSVRYMAQSGLNDRRKSWGLDDTMPPYARALAVWSLGSFVDGHEKLASELFLECGRQRYERTPLRPLCRATVLLDMGFSIAAREGVVARLDLVKVLWRSAAESWDEKCRAYAVGVVAALEASLAGDANAKAYFLNERWWQTSLWSEYLRDRQMEA